MASPRAAELPATADFDLPATRLAEALELFAAQSGASAGMPGRLPAISTRPVKGRFSPLEALQRMLAGSALEPVRLGPASFRLQPRSAPAVAAAAPADSAGPVAPLHLDEVLITASKRAQSQFNLPLSITVVNGSALEQVAPLAGSRAAQDFDAATSSTNLGPGRNRQFIRGVADSPFVGSSQATVSIQYDEARLNYNGPDPDLRLLDIERVEILKGPQGPLYGTGALGGVFHIVPRRPDLEEHSLHAMAFTGDTAHGTAAPGGSAVLNVPIAADRMGLRAVVYGANESGWINNTDGRKDANNTRLKGARVGLRGQGASWTLDVQGIAQLATTRDSQYVTTRHSLDRAGILPEPSDNDLYMGSATLHMPLAGFELLLTSSYVNQEVSGVRDASAAAALFGSSAPARYDDIRTHRLFSSELRVSSSNDARIPWLLGLAQLDARSRSTGRLDPAPASGATVLDLARSARELALFGEATLPVAAGLGLTAGLRVARASEEDESSGTGAPELEAGIAHTLTPSMSVDWHSPDRRRFIYLRLAQAVRPGGLNPDGATSSDRRFHSDELTNLDLGLRMRLRDDTLTLQSVLFVTQWDHVQSDYLLPNGLSGTRNVGEVRNVGIESQLHRGFGGYALEFGAVLQHARLHTSDSSVASDNARPPVVPDVRASLTISRNFNLLGWEAQLQTRLDYIGASHLSFIADLDRRSPGHATLGSVLRLTRSGYALQLHATNLLDSRADTFAFGNSFSIRTAPQYTPLQPRTVTLQVEHSW